MTGGHKYIKRTGVKGNYRYWYKLPDGRVVEGNDAQQKQGRIEHVKRLIAGKGTKHELTHGHIAELTGHDPGKVGSLASNMRTARRAGGSHDFTDEHLDEAHHENPESPGTPSTASAPSAPSAPAATPAPRSRPARGVSRGRGLEPEGPTDSESAPRTTSPAAPSTPPPTSASQPAPASADAGRGGAASDPAAARKNQLLAKLRAKGLDLGDDDVAPAAAAPTATPAAPAPATPAAAAVGPQPGGYRPGEGFHLRDLASAIDASQRHDAAAVGPQPGVGTRASEPEAAEMVRSGYRPQGDGRWQHPRDGTLLQKMSNGKWKGKSDEGEWSEQYRDLASAIDASRQAARSPNRSPSTDPIMADSEAAQRHAAGSSDAADAEGARRHAARVAKPSRVSNPSPSGRPATPQVPGPGARGMTGTPRHPLLGRDAPDAPAAPSAPAAPAAAAPAAGPRPESHSTTPHGQELVRFDPDFAASEEATNKMIDQQRQGANPYLTRAVDVFGRIMGDVQEPRKTKAKHMLSAIVKARNEAGGDSQLSEDLVLAHYKAMPGNERVRSLPKDDFERATFHSLDEILANKPVDPELERMKRGYAAKQFSRCKPFLKQSFLSANPSAPPPYPTFGDLKSWGDHASGGGGDKPAWAGNTRTAVPKEVHDGAHKGPDGKPQYPPAWLPLHLMPVWNYVAAKHQAAGTNAYQQPALGSQQLGSDGRVNLSNQAGAQEGILTNALRKYVQQRGGSNQLIDIPKSKLSEVGKTHEEIFKSKKPKAGGDDFHHTLKHKIVDPVSLMPHVMKELGIKVPKAKAEKPVKKSFMLVVNADAEYVPGETLIKAEPRLVIDLVKSERISRIQEVLRGRGL